MFPRMSGDLPPCGASYRNRIRGSLISGLLFLAQAPFSSAQLPAAPAPAKPLATAAPPAITLAPDAGRIPADKRYLPSSINEPLMSMTIQVIQETPAESIYRSRHFEFSTPVKLGAGSMKEICRSFESTYELVSKLPWGINPWPEDGRIFHAKLYATREQYFRAGAPQWSAGVYSPMEKVFRIPFEEVGLRNRGSDYYLGGPINNDTITHEVTHQMMHEYLRFMPIWMAEGLAEYTSNIPYTSGRYNVSGAVEGFKQMRKNYGKVKQRGLTIRTSAPPKWIGAPSIWAFTTSILAARPITNLQPDPPKSEPAFVSSVPAGMPDSDITELPNRYYSAHALIFYFMHYDGDGKATRLKKFFDAIHEERKQWAVYNSTTRAAYELAVKKYEADWEAFKKQPGVIDMGGGRIRFPSNLKPPAEPVQPLGPGGVDPTKVCAKHLGILLDGRSLEQLDNDFRAAFSKAEIQ